MIMRRDKPTANTASLQNYKDMLLFFAILKTEYWVFIFATAETNKQINK